MRGELKLTQKLLILFGFIILVFNNLLFANTGKMSTRQIEQKLHKSFPELSVDKIIKGPVPNFYQVDSGAEIFYISTDGDYLFSGSIISLKDKKNLTETALNKLRIQEINKLPANAFISYVPKNQKPKYTVIVFTDIDCPYCRKFHQELNDYLKEGIEIRYVPFPRAGLGSESYYKAVQVWCAKNPQKALDLAKLTPDEYKVKKEHCMVNPVPKALEVVQALHLQGTPALVLSDGTVLPGYVPPKKLLKVLQEKNK